MGAIIFQEDAGEVFLCGGCFFCAHPLLFSKKIDHTSLTSVWKLIWRSRQRGTPGSPANQPLGVISGQCCRSVKTLVV